MRPDPTGYETGDHRSERVRIRESWEADWVSGAQQTKYGNDYPPGRWLYRSDREYGRTIAKLMLEKMQVRALKDRAPAPHP